MKYGVLSFHPHLEIMHRPGKVHSRVDPLLRLKCCTLGNILPLLSYEPTLSFISKVNEEHPFQSPQVQYNLR